MRDPKRIDGFLAALGDYWKAHPDWRLGQLLENAADAAQQDVYYIEEEEILQGLQKMEYLQR